jgi:hypothetical protein
MEENARISTSLSELELAILDFEAHWWRHAGSKAEGVQEKFGIALNEYYQRLNALLDNESALAHAPLLVKRLRRTRRI